MTGSLLRILMVGPGLGKLCRGDEQRMITETGCYTVYVQVMI